MNTRRLSRVLAVPAFLVLPVAGAFAQTPLPQPGKPAIVRGVDLDLIESADPQSTLPDKALVPDVLQPVAQPGLNPPARPGTAKPAGAEVSMEGLHFNDWGTALNPADDCLFKPANRGSQLTITVPAGSQTAHNLCSELDNMRAPRVLQAVKGDFDMQVKVEGAFEPGKKVAYGSRVPYVGAGLLVQVDERNYVRMERATKLYARPEPTPYLNFEIRVDGELQRFGTMADFVLDPAKPVWLRLERRGKTMRGAITQGGQEWSYGPPKELTSDAWNQETVQAGVAAVSSSLQEFAPVYTDLNITKPDRSREKAEKEKEKEPEAEGTGKGN